MIYGYQKKWLRRTYLGPDAEAKPDARKSGKATRRVTNRGMVKKAKQPGSVDGNACKSALWKIAFPATVKTDLNTHTKEDKRLYRIEAKAAVKAAVKAGAICPVVEAIKELREGSRYGWPICDRINEVHHKFGRMGDLLRWQPGWLLVSKAGHRWIHSNIAEARRRGWIAPHGKWNDQNVTKETK